MSARHRFFCVCILMLMPSVTWASTASPELVIEAPPELASTAADVERIARGNFNGAFAITGVYGFSSSIRVVLAPNDSPLAKQTPRWISGFADGARRTVVLFPGRVSSYPDDSLATLVHHEIAHVLVDEAARGRPVPRWFHEGVATVAAREWGIEDRARYAVAVVGRRARNTEDLDVAFAAGGRRAARAYALSGAFVRWMRIEYGVQVTARILELLGRDIGFREAFVRATGDTIERAEHRFFVREALWHTWVPFLTSSGVLWAAITGLAVYAFRRRREKSAAMHERWDAEEELLAGHETPELRRRVDFAAPRTLDDVDDDVVN